MNFGWGWEGPVLGSKVSSRGELELPSDAWARSPNRLDAESVEEDERSGVGNTILSACAMVFFFLLRSLGTNRG